jgi:winged helix DNA-binding protein
MATERTLTERELNRSLLARQLLLERAELPLPRAVERVGGLQTQYAPSAYISLWSRLSGFDRGDLTRALERRSVVQGTLMRVTIHVVSARDYPLLAEGLRHDRRRWWLRAQPGRPDAREVAAAARRTRILLADGPRRRSELVERLGVDDATWNGVSLWIDLVRAPPSGTWERRRADLYATADDWLGHSDATREEGLELLIRRYLGGFGPASSKDIASWAGLPVTQLIPALQRMSLRRFRDERGAELFDLPRAPLPDPETPAPVRFLATWDASLLVHARRTQILPERYRTMVFNTKTPHSVSTFLVDGRVAGAWRYEGGRVQVQPFGRLSREARRDLADEAERLAAFLA